MPVSKLNVKSRRKGYTNENGTAEDCGPASTKGPIKHDGQSFIGDDIAEQESDQNPMFAFLQELEHLFCILLL